MTLVATLCASCEADPDAEGSLEPLVAETTSLPLPPLLARAVDPTRLFVIVDIDGTTRRLDRPDASGRWVLRHPVTTGDSFDLEITWWYTLDGPEPDAIRLAVLSRSLPSVPAGATLAVDGGDYTSDLDEDEDGSTNLEEIVAGTDPRAGPGTIEPLPPSTVPFPADAPGSAYYRFANNGTRLQGPAIGSGIVPNASLARALPFRVENAEEGLEVVGARTLTLGPTDSAIVLVVANRSTRIKCLVQIGYTLAGTNEPSSLSDITFVAGTTGLAGGRYTSTCIGPGSLAFTAILREGTLDTFDSITVDALASSDLGRFELPGEPIVEVVSYRLVDGDVGFLVANRSDATLDVISLQILLLDAEGFPLGFAAAFPTDRVFAPGQERELVPLSGFAGSVTSVRVVATLAGAAE